MSPPRHLLVVEAYDGIVEFLSASHEERAGARALGLPVADIANRLDCRITILTWDDWLSYEATSGTFLDWIPFPATRAVTPPGPPPVFECSDPRIRVRAIPAHDPGHGEPLAARGPSPLAYGLLADSDPLFLLSYVLHQTLESLFVEDPFDAVMVPMWGGAGYTAQLSRATGIGALGSVPFVTVVTDTSRRRHELNGEGLWTRPGITRRQMEDVSLALADVALAFGPRGSEIARNGRLPEAGSPLVVPRRIPDGAIERLSASAAVQSPALRVELFLDEPQDAASGVLAAMDAVSGLSRAGLRFDGPVVSAGPEATFAPMKGRNFTEYWSSRGFVRELLDAGSWSFQKPPSAAGDVLPVRLYPSGFEHLPSIWGELGRGSGVLLSPGAMEGLASGAPLPADLFLPEEPGALGLGTAMRALLETPVARLDEMRRELCSGIAAGLAGPRRTEAFEGMCHALEGLLGSRPHPQPLDRAARMFLDRTRPLGQAASAPARPMASADGAGRLSVVIACHNMGGFVAETLESIWNSDRIPDEVLLVDDGSDDAVTLDVLTTLQAASKERSVPLTLLRQNNRGLAGARNAGLAAATGEFVSFIDADDLIEPEFYRLAMEVMRGNPGLGGVAAWALMFGEGLPPAFWNAPQAELPLLLVENTVVVPCLMRTATLRALGGYDALQRYNYEDWELSLRLLATGNPIVTLPRYLQRYRMRQESLWRTMTAVQNQGMRERMLSRHRETVSRFSVEVAMQLEHRLMQRVYAAHPAPVEVPPPPEPEVPTEAPVPTSEEVPAPIPEEGPANVPSGFARSAQELLSSLIRRGRRRT